MVKIKKILWFFLLLLIFFTACSAKPDAEYSGHSFYSPYVEYLGQAPEEAYPALEETGEWNYLYTQSGQISSRPMRRETVMIDGLEYSQSIACNKLFIWGFENRTTVTASDDAEKTAAVQKVYDLLTVELGEPEEMTVGREELPPYESLEQALRDGFPNEETGRYKAWWVIDEDLRGEALSENSEWILACCLAVEDEGETISISVQYLIRNPRDLETAGLTQFTEG